MNFNLISKLNANLFLLFIAGKLKTSTQKIFLHLEKLIHVSQYLTVFLVF